MQVVIKKIDKDQINDEKFNKLYEKINYWTFLCLGATGIIFFFLLYT